MNEQACSEVSSTVWGSGGEGERMMNLPGKGGVNFHKNQHDRLWTW